MFLNNEKIAKEVHVQKNECELENKLHMTFYFTFVFIAYREEDLQHTSSVTVSCVRYLPIDLPLMSCYVR